jgi:hypothetical protein
VATGIHTSGGELTGDVKRLDGTEDQAQGVLPVGRDSRAF